MGLVPVSTGCEFGFGTIYLKPKPINPLVNRECFIFSPQSSNFKENFPKLRVDARHPARKESAKIKNRRIRKKLYAMLVDDQNKKILFYASTLQKSICEDPSYSVKEAAQRVGEELVKACKDMNITEISSYDRNGLARGERIIAFETAISEYGFLPR